MPELTVSMPAYNSGKFIKDAIESVLRQRFSDFELIVVDDSSQDDTAAVAGSFKDPRIKLIRNGTRRGISYCHNAAIRQSSSPFIIHVDSDDLVMPGAFQKMLAAIKSSHGIGQAHCLYFFVDEHGRTIRDAFYRDRERVLGKLKPGMDYRRELLVSGSVMNHLRTYRREVFNEAGLFDERINNGEDYDMAVRIADKFKIQLVPEFLYVRRRHKNNVTSSSIFREFIFWHQKLFICLRLMRDKKIRYFRQKEYDPVKLMIEAFFGRLRKLNTGKHVRRIEDIYRKILNYLNFNVLAPVGAAMYKKTVCFFPFWPARVPLREEKRIKKKKIAYYLWHYPVLSQTFVRREVAELREGGVDILVIADAPEDAGDEEGVPAEEVRYLLPLDRKSMSDNARHFFLKDPFLFAYLFLYVLFNRYGENKSFKEDKKIFLGAVYLAGEMKVNDITHVHSPWANSSALIALLASRMLGITYSVQARAYDIHRNSCLCGLAGKLENAEFIITNTEYNRKYLGSLVTEKKKNDIHVIYNGIDPEKFRTPAERGIVPEKIRILCVGRIVEQKGMVYLLKALRLLKDKGYSFACEIIGRREAREYINYYVKLKRLCSELGLEDVVVFRGAMPFGQVLREYAGSDIFVLPCIIAEDGSRDITPNVLIEAMAMEMPVISTAITGIPEMIENGASGILVPPNDEDSLAGALIKLIEDHDLRVSLGRNARKTVEEKFNIHRNAVRFRDLFCRI